MRVIEITLRADAVVWWLVRTRATLQYRTFLVQQRHVYLYTIRHLCIVDTVSSLMSATETAAFGRLCIPN